MDSTYQLQAELDYQAFQEEMLKEFREHDRATALREHSLNEISEDIVGCPYDIIDDIMDDEAAIYAKCLINHAYYELYQD